MSLAALIWVTSGLGREPAKVDTEGLVAKIIFDRVLAGFLTELNSTSNLRVPELPVEPRGYVGEHNHRERRVWLFASALAAEVGGDGSEVLTRALFVGDDRE